MENNFVLSFLITLNLKGCFLIYTFFDDAKIEHTN